MGRRRALSHRPVRRAGVLAATAGLLAACTTVTAGAGSTGEPSATPSVTTGSSAASPSPGSTPGADCPTTYAAPDPNRPRVRLAFTVAPDLATVTGTEHIEFTPDAPISELVFRLTANTAPTVAEGNRIVVTSARADNGGGRFRVTRSGAAASTQGGILHIPFAQQVPAGRTVTADLAFTLTLGRDSFDRFGRSATSRFAWFGSAQPLLAWERGFGWHDEDLIDFTAESATSEAMDTELSVTAPADLTVVMSGDPQDPTAAGGGTRTWTSTIATARDVSVAVGPFAVTDTVVDGVRLRVGGPDAAVRDRLVPEFRRAITALAARFGPFPFPSLSVAALPASGGGIEYPGSILMLDDSRLVAVHETAHQWFYAMVGNSQSLHPWLDEAFAEYAEKLVDSERPLPGALDVPGAVDRSAESYGANGDRYYFITYFKGSAALTAAREAAGAARFDAALRCYVAANAWTVADPVDLEKALRGLPAAVGVLRRAGALP